MSTVLEGKSHLFPTSTIGTSSESLTLFICSLKTKKKERLHLTSTNINSLYGRF